MLTQWHRDPFSSLNLDPKYLHRPHRDQDEAALSSVSLTPTKHVASKDRTNIKNREEDNVENHNDIESEEFDDADNEELIRLAGIIAKGLLLSRKVVWDCVVDRLRFFVSSST